jgi:methyl-accepting chemotaxis protein
MFALELFVDNLKIANKFVLAFVLIVTIVMIMCGVVYRGLGAVAEATQKVNTSRSILREAGAAQIGLIEKQSAIRGFIASGDHQFLKRNQDFLQQFQTAIDHLSALATDAQTQEAIARLKVDAARVSAEHDQIVALGENPATLEQARAGLSVNGRLMRCREDLKVINDIQTGVLQTWASAQMSAIRAANVTLMIGGLMVVALSVALGWLLSRAIATPVATMTAAMRRLSGGDTTVAIPAIGRGDEIGQMAGAVQIFKDNAIDKLRFEQEAQARRPRPSGRGRRRCAPRRPRIWRSSSRNWAAGWRGCPRVI